ncbi:MAG: motility protein MotB [Gammaproteobacteria bacterium HGW-Gammaproteobacteria-1]|jgi:chemotaxis protein MotB|nr:MAG: motility protein MotB [Gammaproteobacteria bacterium HGW-Gammaproteobacteria-1]
MALEDKKQPIVVKKIKKGGHGHHGGAWKVAYADFVTAMMAFFLLMWLLGSTTQEERVGISDFFQNPSAIEGPGGASTSMIELGGAMEVPRGEGEPLRDPSQLTPEDISEIIEDKARLDELMQKLKEQIEISATLKDFKDQLLLDITSEGLRIQIVDRENRPMFDLGSTRLKSYTRAILSELTRTINEVPNHVSLTGHTDAAPFSRERTDYSNWELSSDRANAARREMVAAGMPERKFGRVVGLADSVMFDKENRFNPVNRRISIVVLNKATERAIGLTDDAPVVAPPPAIAPPLPAAPVAPPPAAPAAPAAPAITPRPAPTRANGNGNGVESAIEGVLGPAPGR